MTRILQSKAFLRIPPANIQHMFMRLQELPVKAGQVVIEQGEDGALAAQPALRLGALHVAPDQLQRHVSVERSQLTSAMNHTHPALPELFTQFVAPDTGRGLVVGGRRE